MRRLLPPPPPEPSASPEAGRRLALSSHIRPSSHALVSRILLLAFSARGAGRVPAPITRSTPPAWRQEQTMATPQRDDDGAVAPGGPTGKPTAPGGAGGPVIVQPHEGATLYAFGNAMQILLGGAETDGRLALGLETTPPGGGPPRRAGRTWGASWASSPRTASSSWARPRRAPGPDRQDRLRRTVPVLATTRPRHTTLPFHRPRRKTIALTTASVEKDTATAQNAPRGPRPRGTASA